MSPGATLNGTTDAAKYDKTGRLVAQAANAAGHSGARVVNKTNASSGRRGDIVTIALVPAGVFVARVMLDT